MSSDEMVTITIEVRRSTLQEVLDLVEDPEQCYPDSEAATNFFELNWDLAESLAAKAEDLGMRPSHEDEEDEHTAEEEQT